MEVVVEWDVGLSVGLLLIATLVWLGAIGSQYVDPEPPRPHDPMEPLRHITETWTAPLPEPGTWYGFSGREPANVQLARILSRTGYEDEDFGLRLRLRMRLTTGQTVEVQESISQPRHVIPGALIPVRVERSSGVYEVSLVGELDPAEVRRLLLNDRLARGLIDQADYALLAGGRYRTVAVRHIRPTGRLSSGQVEVAVGFTTRDGTPGDMAGFLRPHELAAARHTGTASGCHDDKGRWVLGPTWY
jgi:hypothetical protein